jgi:hypothetical protein
MSKSRKKTLLYGLIALLIALLAQALWESPLQAAVWQITYIGGWLAWHLRKPSESSEATVWVFDLIAMTANAIVYFSVMRLLDYSLRLRKGRRQRAV